MGNKIIPCGGWYVNDEHFTITYQNGKPIIDIIPEEAINDFVKKSGDTMSGSLDLENSSLLAEDVISKQVTVIGATIESSTTNGVRLTSTTDQAAAFVLPNTQNTYVPLYIANPTNASQAATKSYVDSKYEEDIANAVQTYLQSNEGKAYLSSLLGENN